MTAPLPAARRAAPLPRARGALALLALAALLPAGPAGAALPVPALTGPVVDQAGLLRGGEAQRLERLARAARAEKGGAGVQLQFLLVPSLEGEAIEDFSMRVAETWRLGSRAGDDGVLVTVSRDDRRVRIEVGGGLEGGLTDAQSARIIRETVVPAFRERRYGEGLYGAGVQILGALGSLPRDAAPAARSRPGVRVSSLGVAAFVILFLLLRIATGFGVRRRRSLWGLPWGGGGLGGGWGGGGLGGGSWGGGSSWGGGGGGFSGGGSSGSW